jgi:hypothetical protein
MFHEKVAIALESREGQETPAIEVPRKVIDYYNRHSLDGFDKAGYFIYKGVKVFETGKREQFEKRDSLTVEQLNHGGR